MSGATKPGDVVTVLLEYDETEKRIYFRGSWPREQFVPVAPRRPGNLQNEVQTFFGSAHDVRAFHGLIPD